MKIIIGGRQSGKTRELLELAHNTNLQLVVRDGRVARKLSQEAHQAGFKIRQPITHSQFINGFHRGQKRTGYLIDDLDIMLSYIALGSSVVAVTLTDPQCSEVE